MSGGGFPPDAPISLERTEKGVILLANKRKNRKLGFILGLVLILVVFQGAAAFWIVRSGGRDTALDVSANPVTQPTAVQTEAVPTQPSQTEPTIPEGPVQLVQTATIGALGDIIPDLPIINAYETETGYDFDGIFRFLSPYSQGVDYAVASLETTLAGTGEGLRYDGFLNRNCPDEIVDSLKAAGFEMLLTANNHSYDTGSAGLQRTIDVIAQRGLQNLGTSRESTLSKYTIVDINGIRVGMLSYTMESPIPEDGQPGTVYLGPHQVQKEDLARICTYLPEQPDLLCAELQWNLNRMRQQGAEASVVFLHWGNSYSLKASDDQKYLAQQLCNMGVDVIVGTHPHVVEPAQLLTSTTDPAHQTVCLYSLGNAVSNQRFGSVRRISTAHTEDGLFFTFTFCKYSDGSVYLSDVGLLPLWMEMRPELQRSYNIIPLDDSLRDQWQSLYGLSDAAVQAAGKSYNRTSKILGTAGTELREALAAARELREADYLADWVGAQYATEEST